MLVLLSILFQATPPSTASSNAADSSAVRNILIGAGIAIVTTVATTALAEAMRDHISSRRHRRDAQRELIDKAQEMISSLVHRMTILQWEFGQDDKASIAKRVTQIEGFGADLRYLKVLASRIDNIAAGEAIQALTNPPLALSEKDFAASAKSLTDRGMKAIEELGTIRRTI